jgi:hypothetical protein
MGAGCLFFDSDRQILVVKPVFEPPIALPRGIPI